MFSGDVAVYLFKADMAALNAAMLDANEIHYLMAFASMSLYSACISLFCCFSPVFSCGEM